MKLWPFLLVGSALAFNLDVYSPLYKLGPSGTYFGYSVAQHFKGSNPVILVGAPKAESGQKGTQRAGALFACPVTTSRSGEGACRRIRAEYEDPSAYERTPDETNVMGRQVHPLGKDGELLGAAVASQGTRNNGTAVVCAPLLRFHNTSAYAQGSCYSLNNDLTFSAMYATCMQKNLPKSDRHNEYGACMEGISVAITPNTLITGVIGAKKWTGGVFAKMQEGDIFGKSQEKFTMAAQEGGSIRSLLTSHDYLGYSVGVGHFGFWHEENGETVVSGATRSGQHGAVVFLPFTWETGDHLSLTEDRFVLNGTKMGSAFGYSLAVLDLNADGFDDLVVGAPFEHRADADGHFGGIVYVYFSQGIRRGQRESHKVFHPPIVLKGPGFFSEFGLSIAPIGNIDGDLRGFQDFAVGAPYANEGAGAVYIYLGAENPKEFRRKPAQTIRGSDLPSFPGKPMKSFGFSLSGGIDADGNGYPDVVVGAVSRDAAVILRSRPVVTIVGSHHMTNKFVDIEKGRNCPRGSTTCFEMSLQISLEDDAAALVDFSEDVLTCQLEVISVSSAVAPRAFLEGSHNQNHSWPCGRQLDRKDRKQLSYPQKVYIPSDQSNDWIHPLKFRFSVKIKGEKKPSMPSEGASLVDLAQYPVLNKYGAVYEFTVPFNTRCGDDQVCQSDLSLKAAFTGVPRTEKGYVMNVGDKDHLDIAFNVANKKEKAYQAALYLTYDPEELELPTLTGRKLRVSLETVGKNMVIVYLGNPMDAGTEHSFDIRFRLVRGRTEGIGRPLEFHAVVNSTSEETDPNNNEWKASVQIIKKAELELIGTSDPHTVYFGGEVKGESAMDLEEDIGVMVRHNYTLHNKGPWTVRNVVAKFEWPYQVESRFRKGKWALYLLDTPTVTMFNTDGTTEIRKCTVDRPLEHVNPVEHIKLNTMYTTHETERRPTRRLKRETKEEENLGEGEVNSAGLFSSRVAPKKRNENGEFVDVVTISCAERTAKCFSISCYFDFLDANAAPVIDFRARLWNSTFIEDYYDVEYVEIVSMGRIELDASQGIEDDPSNNEALAVTTAYPDRPQIGETRKLSWWIILAAVAIGLLILLLLVLILWRCGFFKRNKPAGPTLHTAQLKHEQEEWANI